MFNKIHVSTDSEKIARVAETYGAKPEFLRPKELSTDEAPIIDVVKYVSSKYPDYQNVALLYAASPFITGEILDDAHFQFVTQQDPKIRVKPLLAMNTWKDAGMFCFYDKDHIERKNFRFYEVPWAIDLNTIEDWNECLRRAS